MPKIREDESASGGVLVLALVGVVALAVGGAAGFVIGDKRGKAQNATAVIDAAKDVEVARSKTLEAEAKVSEMETKVSEMVSLVKSSEERVAIADRRVKELEAWKASMTGKTAQADQVHEAENGAVKFGEVMISVIYSEHTNSNEGFEVVNLGVKIDVPKEAKSTLIKGWSYDPELYEKLSGKNVSKKGPDPLPVNFFASSEKDSVCRGVMRSVMKVGETNREISIKEMKSIPGESYYWIISFERPSPAAKRFTIDLDAADLGSQGRIRFSIPNVPVWRPAKKN